MTHSVDPLLLKGELLSRFFLLRLCQTTSLTYINVINFAKVDIISSTDMMVAKIGGRKTWLAKQVVCVMLAAKNL
jgi:hypothetical protein